MRVDYQTGLYIDIKQIFLKYFKYFLEDNWKMLTTYNQTTRMDQSAESLGKGLFGHK